MITDEITREPRVQPAFIEPMQVQPVRELPDGGQWTYEAKLDGYRCLVARRNGSAALWSRRGTIFTARFSQIAGWSFDDRNDVRHCSVLSAPFSSALGGSIVGTFLGLGSEGPNCNGALKFSGSA